MARLKCQLSYQSTFCCLSWFSSAAEPPRDWRYLSFRCLWSTARDAAVSEIEKLARSIGRMGEIPAGSPDQGELGSTSGKRKLFMVRMKVFHVSSGHTIRISLNL